MKKIVLSLWKRLLFVFAISGLLLSPDGYDAAQNNSNLESAGVSSNAIVSAASWEFLRGRDLEIRKTEKKYDEKMLNEIIARTASLHDIDPAIIKAIVRAESGYDPKAVSKKGARGLMQLMPETAKAMGVDNSFDPEHNIRGGVKYFKMLLDKFDGEMELALAAYNAGTGKVRKYNGVPPYRATKRFIRKVIRYYNYYKEKPFDTA